MDHENSQAVGVVIGYLSAIVLSTSIILNLCGCAVDPKKESLANYVNHDILAIASIESVAFERYAAVTGKNYTTDEAVYTALRDEVIPVYKRFNDLLNQVHLDDERIARVHGHFVKGSRKILKGFETKLHGIAAKDDTLIILGNKRIDIGIEEALIWRKEILALAEKRGLRNLDRKKSKIEKFFYSMDEFVTDIGPTGQ